MSVYYTLYKAIKSLCPSSYRASFSTLKKNHENVYGIYFKGGAPTGRVLDDGSYKVRSVNVIFNVNASKSPDGVLEGYKFCEDVVRALETTANYEYIDPDTGDRVVIINVVVLGDINALGVNSFDIPSFSLNFIINYAGR